MNNNINQLLEKYWNAEASLQEEAELRLYFSSNDINPEHIPFKGLFSHINTERLNSTDLDVTALISGLDNMDEMLDKYWNAETTIEDEQTIKAYFNSGDVSAKHRQFAPLFALFKNNSELKSEIDIQKTIERSESDHSELVEKYWNAETTLEEEAILTTQLPDHEIHKEEAALFEYFATMKAQKSNLDLGSLFESEAQKGTPISDKEIAPRAAKVINFRKIATGIAAVFVLGFAAITLMNQTKTQEIQYKGKFVNLDEEAEAQEAYEVTKQALAFLSKNMKSGSKTVVSSVKKAEKASIFK